ncbi:uncharacterized protein M421DRAFT_414935 [Didymella exigua CBS 183.55]|uniref:DUF202 domain-containing protein n=1 Tax=Didymella exigua CBS 183.55 TaxID=1150837 RepID=A0A6A5S5V8_9PLEO|nr:uncharacterized protein M421DRAFT_414935 [Didymella exigua CBS 183.55]KAF1933886.1 hypothetical protein M421DRAFT_414935 [Didymella exigua CBS 183.55]
MSSSNIYMTEPPIGQIRHTINTPNIHKELIAVGVSTTILAFVAIVLRIFTRSHVTKNGINFDDYMVTCAMLFSLVLLV